MKFKKEKVLILKCKNEKYPERRTEINARTFVYRGHKFNLQGNYNTGYSISDSDTGMGLSSLFNIRKISFIDDKWCTDKLDYFIDSIMTKAMYIGAIDRFNKAPIIKEED